MPFPSPEALIAIERGDLRGLTALTEGAGGAIPAEREQVEALVTFYRYFAGIDVAMPNVASWLSGITATAATPDLLRLAQRAALLRLDGPGVKQVADAMARTVNATDPRRRCATAWANLVDGKTDEAIAALADVALDAKAQGFAPTVIEATALTAWAHLSSHNAPEAVASARRAFRMARAEELPQSQYLAGILLARSRRYAGSPHLAKRILGDLVLVAPPAWHDWVRWEDLLAGRQMTGTAHGTAAPLVFALERVLAGDGLATPEDLLALFREFVPLAEEVSDLVAGATESATPASATMRSWIEGQTPLPPRGYREFGAPVIGYVLATTSRSARRMMGFGASKRKEAVIDPPPSKRRQERTEMGLAVLMLAPNMSMVDREFFASVYGFDFDPGVHGSIFDSLLHRMREYVGDAARIQGAQNVVALEPLRDFLIEDPRCRPELEERVLQAVAAGTTMTAQSIAEHLGVPLRTVQTSLKGLVDMGACQPVKEGRHVAYEVEDTTFHEPTTVGV